MNVTLVREGPYCTELLPSARALSAVPCAVATAQGTANSALALGSNSVQYGPSRTNVTFNAGGQATVLSNVAAGVSTTDAVNVGQLNSGINSAVTQANAYTDGRIAALDFDLRNLRRDSFAGTSNALAAAGLPQAYEAGKGMIAMGGGTYAGQSAVAVGMSKFLICLTVSGASSLST